LIEWPKDDWMGCGQKKTKGGTIKLFIHSIIENLLLPSQLINFVTY
jgi:hypothetical protein